MTVKLLGGDLLIEWDREQNKIYMTGPAEVVLTECGRHNRKEAGRSLRFISGYYQYLR